MKELDMQYLGVGIALGSGIGVAIGTGIGVAFGNMGIGIAIGASVGASIGIAISIAFAEQKAQAARTDICQKCGYATKDLPSGVCPECGGG